MDSLQKEANARLVQSEREGKEERQVMQDTAERANAVISQLQEENERLAVELAEAQNQVCWLGRDVGGVGLVVLTQQGALLLIF